VEDKLRKILEMNQPENRYKHVYEWKGKGGKVIGLISNYVPEELFTATDILPFRITGSWRENVQHAKVYRPENSCGFCNHVLESYLAGEFDILDGIVAADIDQDVVRLLDVMSYLKRIRFIYIVHVPFTNRSELNYRYFANELKRLSQKLCRIGGKEITDDDLLCAIKLHDEIRGLLSAVYDMRKREHPPVSGEEVLRLISSVCVMPKSEALKELKVILPYIRTRKANLKSLSPRLMIISDMLDHPGYLDLVEATGSVVVMDDMDLGSRYVYLPPANGEEDPFLSLATRYLKRHGSARMATWGEQADQIIAWVNEFKVDGILGLPLAWCYPHQYRIPYLVFRFDQSGIPNIFIDREYHLSNVGQLRTRIGAFIESLRKEGKKWT